MHDCVVPICRYARKGPGLRRRIPTQALIRSYRTDAPYLYTGIYTALWLFTGDAIAYRIQYVDSYNRCTHGNMRIEDAFCRVRITAWRACSLASLVAVAFDRVRVARVSRSGIQGSGDPERMQVASPCMIRCFFSSRSMSSRVRSDYSYNTAMAKVEH